MARFIAIPVAHGDAFYLDRHDLSVLIDGGENRSAFASMFQNATQADGVDIIVCSHNDADHANGILGFLKAGLGCKEAWLPGRWLGVLPHLLKPFVEVFVNIAENVAQAELPPDREHQTSGLSPIEAYAEHLRERLDEIPLSADGSPLGEDGWPESYVHMLEQAEPWEATTSAWPWWLLEGKPWLNIIYHNSPQCGSRAVQLLWSAIEAALRIRAIALQAFHRGIPVRWFEFDTTRPSGGMAALEPVNARAIALVRPLVGPLLDWLALTVWNRESLVFWSPPTEDHPGVLFTADSDLSQLNLPRQLLNAIATSPHHGSQANAKAYAEVGTAAGHYASSITWVRSDRRYRRHPGEGYLSLSSRRLCTICRLGGGMWSPKQPVRLSSQGGIWVPQPPTTMCSCKKLSA